MCACSRRAGPTHTRAECSHSSGRAEKSSARAHTHTVNLRKAGASEERIAAVGTWHDVPFFGDAERAAPQPAERMARLADRCQESVPDALRDGGDHFDEKQLSAPLLSISRTTRFNRVNTTIREPAGTTWG